MNMTEKDNTFVLYIYIYLYTITQTDTLDIKCLSVLLLTYPLNVLDDGEN